MKGKISVRDGATLASEIATLTETTPADLKSRWRVLYGTEPPPRISRDLLTRAVAYRIQEKALGAQSSMPRRCSTASICRSNGRRNATLSVSSKVRFQLHRSDAVVLRPD